MVRDPLADFLVRIKNAQAVKKESAMVPYSNVLWEAAKLLEKEGYLTKVDRRGKRNRRMIEIGFVYDDAGHGRIDGARRISRLSQRIYKKASELHPVKHGYGTQVVSTSKGLMTQMDAKKARLGGEVLFEIW